MNLLWVQEQVILSDGIKVRSFQDCPGPRLLCSLLSKAPL